MALGIGVVGQDTGGDAGSSGFSGRSGFSGVSGFSGYSGISGFSGYSGKSGYSGISGAGVAAGSDTQVQFNSSGNFAGDADLTFVTDTLTVTKLGATTLTGTIAGGGQQLNNIIIGTTTPLAGFFTDVNATGRIVKSASTLTDTVPGFSFTATMPTTIAASNYAANFQVTGAGSSSQLTAALNIDYLAGYTGSNYTNALQATNASAGTGTAGRTLGAANYGFYANAIGATTGHNVGAAGYAQSGTVNIGMGGRASAAKDSATNIGVLGLGLNSGATPIQLGGYFGLQNTAPTFASAALMADNGATTSDIFVARDNGTATFTIADGGVITATGIAEDTAQTDSTMCITAGGLILKGTGALGICLGTSSLRFKDNVTSFDRGLSDILSLRPISFIYKSGFGDGGLKRQSGFAAEDNAKGPIDDLVGYDKKGKPSSFDMFGLVPRLVNAIQTQQAMMDAMNTRITTLWELLQAKPANVTSAGAPLK